MSLGFRVGVPGMRVRVSTRGVRASVGPRAARVHFGSGRTGVSTGLGPFYAYQSVGGRSGRTTSRRGASSRGPSAAQMTRAARTAERAAQQAERDAAIEQLRDLRRSSTSVHLDQWIPASRPAIPPPPVVNVQAALAQAEAMHLRGVGRLARAQRSAARGAAQADANAYAAAETTRLAAIHADLLSHADGWWNALSGNDEMTVLETVNAAFADNPAAGCAVGLDGTTLSIIMRQQDIDALPDQTPSVTSAGRPTLKLLNKRDRVRWWLHILASNVAATCREAFAVAPGVSRLNVVVISRFSDSRRLGVVLYGSWSRSAVEGATWRSRDDAFRILDIGEDVECSVRTTSSGNLSTTLKPLDVDSVPALAELITSAEDTESSNALAEWDEALGTPMDASGQAPAFRDPYALIPFETWFASRSSLPVAFPQPNSMPLMPMPMPTREYASESSGAAAELAAGQSVEIPETGVRQMDIVLHTSGADVDLSFLLLDSSGHVRDDRDFVFYNHHVAPDQSVRLNGKRPHERGLVESGTVHASAVRPDVTRILVVATMDTASRLAFSALDTIDITISCSEIRWHFAPKIEKSVRAAILAEIYRRPGTPPGEQRWKLRVVGQGWADGLSGLARDHGVDIDD